VGSLGYFDEQIAVGLVDPNLPAGQIRSVDQILSESLSAERFRTLLLISFAIAAMLLATLGIAGLLAYNAAQRMHEFGVRIALKQIAGTCLVWFSGTVCGCLVQGSPSG
jgi:hypothetical protein